MSLRLASIGSLGCLSLCTLLACSESEPAPSNGTGGGGSSSGGTPSGGTAPALSGSANGGSSSAGSPSGGAPSGGSAAAGAAGTSTGGSPSGGTGGSGSGSGGTSTGGGSGGAASKTTFFVTSDTSATGKLGGLTGADLRCQTLATAAGITGHTFKAYLSTSTVNAKDRIGTGPWYNSNGVLLAMNVAELHNVAMVKGNADLFLDEKKQKINGQWNSNDPSDPPNEHDILTGTLADGTVSGTATCSDWTSDVGGTRQVGHSDGMGPGMATDGTFSSWNAAHIVNGCNSTAPGGGSGRIYCFAAD